MRPPTIRNARNVRNVDFSRLSRTVPSQTVPSQTVLLQTVLLQTVLLQTVLLRTVLSTLILTTTLSAEKLTYEDHIYPLFEQSCLNCHNPDKKKGDLDLSSYPALMTGSSGGKVATPGDGGSSKLYTVTTGTEEPVMPPEGDKIDRKSAELIRAWIDQGMLETKDSQARKAAKPKFDLAIDSSAGKPEGPPPMPGTLSLDPAFVAPRAGLVKAMTASPWAPLVALTGQKQILLYHSETFRFLGSLPFPKGQPESLRFHPSGKYLLASGGVAGKSGQAIVWDITTGKELFTAGREFDSVLAAAVTPDLATVAFGGPSRLLKIWNPRENGQTASIKKHTDWITALAASPNGKFLASGDRNGGIHVWDLSGNEIHALRDHQGAVTALEFRADSKLLASTGEDGQLIIWDLKRGSAAKKVNAHNNGTTALHYHRNGHLITAGRDRSVKIFKPDFNQKHHFKDLPEIITAVALSENGKHLFTADFNGEVLVYDVASTKAPLTTLESNPPSLENRLQYLRQQLSQQSQKVTKAKSHFDQQSKKLTDLKNRIAGTRSALQKNEAALKSLENEKNQAQTQNKKLGSQFESLKQPFAQARQEKDQFNNQIKKLEKDLTKAKEQQQNTDELVKQLTNLKTKRDQAVKKESQLASQRKNIGEQRATVAQTLKSAHQRNGELRSLTQEGRNSLKTLESQLPELQKQIAAPKKSYQAELATETQIRADLTYWQDTLEK